MHLKRQEIGKAWPITRKGTKYVITSHERRNGIPILIILREILKLSKNRREAREILKAGLISINGKIIRRENFSVLPFEKIKINEKNYELNFSKKGKFELKESKEKEERILKIINKKILKNKKIQLNLLFGKNIISSEKANVRDSVVVKDKKIIKIIPMETGAGAIIFSGKYRGAEGKIKKIVGKTAEIDCNDKILNIPLKYIMAK